MNGTNVSGVLSYSYLSVTLSYFIYRSGARKARIVRLTCIVSSIYLT